MGATLIPFLFLFTFDLAFNCSQIRRLSYREKMPKKLTNLIIVTYKTKSSGNPEITYLFSNAGDIRSHYGLASQMALENGLH